MAFSVTRRLGQLGALSCLAALSLACSAVDDGPGSGAGGSGSGTGGSGTGTGGTGSGTGGGGLDLDTCGNGALDAGESCDDGDLDGFDGCNAVCQIEADWLCEVPGTPCVKVGTCGDGELASSEVCDDGNTADGDGCAGDCSAVDPGWQCRMPGRDCVPLCGDGVITPPENCDDNNTASEDGCSSTCLTEPGWTCSGTTCTAAVCGNGVVEAGETCDAGVENGLLLGNGLGCTKTCTPEPSCRTGGVTGACATSCGDGNVDPDEDCDDGNQFDGDGCGADCTVEEGFECVGQTNPDTTPCSSGVGNCLVLPVTFRDFEPQNAVGGHPDFFFMGSTANTTDGTKTICVTNASGQPDPALFSSGTCWNTDSTPLCQGLLSSSLGADGKPAVNPSSDLECLCRYTDWDGTGVVNGGGVTPAQCWEGGSSPYRVELDVRTIKDATSFSQWYGDSAFSTKYVQTIELAQLGATPQYQFVSNGGTTIYDDLHAAAPVSLTSGFFPLEAATTAKLCNLWPYWSTWAGCVGTQWDPQANGGSGNFVNNVQGVARNFYFTSEARYLFRFQGGEVLEFDGDDDYWVFVNGKLVLDFGSPHERLVARMELSTAGTGTATWTAEGRNIVSGAGIAVGNGTVTDLGMEVGKTYEIAFFHADRHPRESNYKLTLSSFETTRSICAPDCGDGERSTGEECDEGAGNDDLLYGGCTTECRFGPFCGDGVVNGDEQCDLGRDNTTPYGDVSGCTPGCTTPHFCGDFIADTAYGEECDAGPDGNVGCTSSCEVGLR